jgi:acyl carrier protein
MKNKNLQKIVSSELLQILNIILKKYGKKHTIKDFHLKIYSERIIDSLDFVNFITSIEKKYNFKFKIADIDTDISLSKLLTIILKKKKIK